MTEVFNGFRSPSVHDRIVPTSSPCSHLSTCYPMFIISLDAVSTELLTVLLNKLYIIVSPGKFSD